MKEIESLFLEAEKLFKKNNFEQALEKYKNILNLNKNLIPVLNNIGLIYERIQDNENAEKYYKKIYELAPNDLVIINNLANILFKQYKYSQAKKYLEISLNKDKKQIIVINQLLITYENLKLYKDAYDICEKYFSIASSDKVFCNLYGKTLLRFNKHQEGLKHIKNATGMIEFDEKNNPKIIN